MLCGKASVGAHPFAHSVEGVSRWLAARHTGKVRLGSKIRGHRVNFTVYAFGACLLSILGSKIREHHVDFARFAFVSQSVRKPLGLTAISSYRAAALLKCWNCFFFKS